MRDTVMNGGAELAVELGKQVDTFRLHETQQQGYGVGGAKCGEGRIRNIVNAAGKDSFHISISRYGVAGFAAIAVPDPAQRGALTRQRVCIKSI